MQCYNNACVRMGNVSCSLTSYRKDWQCGTISAPMFQLLDYALNHPDNTTKFSMIYENDTEENIAMKDELDAFKADYPGNFDVTYTLTNPSGGWSGMFAFFQWMYIPASNILQGKRGPIDENMVQEQVSPPRNEPNLTFMIYVAGEPFCREDVGWLINGAQ